MSWKAILKPSSIYRDKVIAISAPQSRMKTVNLIHRPHSLQAWHSSHGVW